MHLFDRYFLALFGAVFLAMGVIIWGTPPLMLATKNPYVLMRFGGMSALFLGVSPASLGGLLIGLGLNRLSLKSVLAQALAGAAIITFLLAYMLATNVSR